MQRRLQLSAARNYSGTYTIIFTATGITNNAQASLPVTLTLQ